MKATTKALVDRVAGIGADPLDDENTALQKALLVSGSFLFMLAGAAWGLLYFYFGETLAGAIPFSYALFSMLSIIYFAVTKRYHIFRFSQLTLILFLPFFLMMALGGYVSGSAVILWALICPFGALLFDKPSKAPLWFVAFLSLVILSGLLQPYLDPANNLSPPVVIFFFTINIIGVSCLTFFLVYYFVGEKNTYQQRSEALLLNILPKEIAAALKKEQRTIADQYDGASILFADMVDFTPIASEMNAVETVELLNEIFSHFDSLVEEYDLEKIKTIGDCYMVASGVPRPRPDHAQAIIKLALDIHEYLLSHSFHVSRPINFRIGINSGPVLAGVIGRKKFIYDLWGDAVNTASRMESHGHSGVIQITSATYELVRDEFVCEPGGTVDVKGKGLMEVWYVTGLKSEGSH